MEGEEAHKEETQEVQAPPEEVKVETGVGSDNPELVQDHNPAEEQKIEEKTDNLDVVAEVPNPEKSEAQPGQENPADAQPDQVVPEIQENLEDRKSSYKKMADGTEGFRLRTIKLRGQVSQGLIIPINVLRVKQH